MTTKHSPLRILKMQADKIAQMLKAAERGEKIDSTFLHYMLAARRKENFTFGIAMDDKLIQIEMPWATIRSVGEVALAELILNLMRESRDTVH